MMPDPIGDAVKRVQEGSLIAYPTETVWGIGADATSDAAIERLRRWKGRGDDAPISILVAGMAGMADLEALGFEVGEPAQKLAGAFWPGPLTLVIPCRRAFARGIAREDGAVGVRCSAHPLASAFARRCEAKGVGPLTATSLNRTGASPALTRAEALALVGRDPDGPRLIEIDTAEAGGDTETTVLDVSGPRPQVLRWGALGAEDLDPVLQEISPT
jgi:L-threonylcarbamoyladenylate synthase